MQSPERKKLSEFVSKKISVDDFSALRVIGKGSYGKVLLVEKIDDKKKSSESYQNRKKNYGIY